MSSPAHNIEIKVRCPDLAAARAVARDLCGETGTIERQVDTYFKVSQGRLKLREIEGRPAVLIAYSRVDAAEARTSAYRLVAAPDPAALKAALAETLGTRGAVSKHREIFLWKNVRIHLDAVDGLGDFIEFEAVLTPGDSGADAHADLEYLAGRFRIDPAALLGPSYSDLLGF